MVKLMLAKKRMTCIYLRLTLGLLLIIDKGDPRHDVELQVFKLPWEADHFYK